MPKLKNCINDFAGFAPAAAFFSLSSLLDYVVLSTPPKDVHVYRMSIAMGRTSQAEAEAKMTSFRQQRVI